MISTTFRSSEYEQLALNIQVLDRQLALLQESRNTSPDLRVMVRNHRETMQKLRMRIKQEAQREKEREKEIVSE